ncbi:MAG: PBP1A family penicillin-binding protein [Treponema sp.]|jgi:penicillin-binding protein 1A|nr:PBP1A family penicillin-binding protein [Treponema sp.]
MGSGRGFFSSIVVKIVAVFTVLLVILIGVGLGLSLAMTANIKNQENFFEFSPALPTKLLDINGTLITEFSSDEKRELVSLSELPRHLVYAVIAREDADFYNHRGFSVKGTFRAVAGRFIGKDWGGGSTITQQVAGTLYCDRTDRSVKRKIKELWWSLQLERRFTKNEILEIYMNQMPMGPGTYGVETASRYFFKHSSREVTLAEAAVLSVLLSAPSRFDPLRNPDLAMNRQHYVLERMIKLGYADADEAERSYEEYWANFDWTRPAISAYYNREDKAPWFSEYVRRELDNMLYGSMDYYRDGYVVYTTLNLAHQEAAEKFFAEGLAKGNREYAATNRMGNSQAERVYVPIVDLLTLAFNLTDIRMVASEQSQVRAVSRYTRNVNPVADMMALMFGLPELKTITGKGFDQLRENTEQNQVEGALISIENDTGYITAIVGGSKYDESNQLIRATQSNVQPGSAYKPLYYSAAIDSRLVTPATMIYDMPMAFHNEDGTPYVPSNYGGAWRGSILLYGALALSLNIPSLKVLETIGFDAAISRSALLLDVDDSRIRSTFPRVFPLGLGIIATSPLKMARAFSIFANNGRVVTPIAIRTVEDRNGRVILDVERDTRQSQRRLANNGQLITPQNAYIMTRMLEFGVTGGTLFYGSEGGAKFTYRDSAGNQFRMPVAGKSGTTQNWSDAWSVGYSPYYTSAVWYGFDKPGNSLGISQSGAALAVPVWADYMREIHRGLPQRGFSRPGGVVDATVCRKSGLLPTDACTDGRVTLPFLAGTVPARYCDIHVEGGRPNYQPGLPTNSDIWSGGFDTNIFDDMMPTLPEGFSLDLPASPPENPPQRGNTRTPARNNRNNRNSTDDTPQSNNTPGGNTPAVIPDTSRPAQREEDEEGAGNDYLPSWDQLN